MRDFFWCKHLIIPTAKGNRRTFEPNTPNTLKRLLAKIYLRLIGWKVNVPPPEKLKGTVMVAAPHTTNYDFPITMACFWYMQVDVKYFIKDDYTKGLFGWFFKWTGAMGVDRSKVRNSLTDVAIEHLKADKSLCILVPAEGSRKRVEKWRTGFYRIAKEAQVPVALGFLDYAKKEGGVLEVFSLSGDFEKDMYRIQETYRPVKGKYPENYNPEIF